MALASGCRLGARLRTERRLEAAVGGVAGCGPTLERMFVRQVPGDGSCLFHSLSVGLWWACNRTHHPMDSRTLQAQSLSLRIRAIDFLSEEVTPLKPSHKCTTPEPHAPPTGGDDDPTTRPACAKKRETEDEKKTTTTRRN